MMYWDRFKSLRVSASERAVCPNLELKHPKDHFQVPEEAQGQQWRGTSLRLLLSTFYEHLRLSRTSADVHNIHLASWEVLHNMLYHTCLYNIVPRISFLIPAPPPPCPAGCSGSCRLLQQLKINVASCCCCLRRLPVTAACDAQCCITLATHQLESGSASVNAREEETCCIQSWAVAPCIHWISCGQCCQKIVKYQEKCHICITYLETCIAGDINDVLRQGSY